MFLFDRFIPSLWWNMGIDISELLQLPAEEKLHIIGELWDSLSNQEMPIPQWQIDEIERRAEAHKQNPGAVSSWKEVKERILRRND